MPARCSQRLDRFLHAVFVSGLVLQITLQCLKDYIGTVPDGKVMQGDAKWCKVMQSAISNWAHCNYCVKPMPDSWHSCMTAGTAATAWVTAAPWLAAGPSLEIVCHWPPVMLQHSQPVAASSFVCFLLKCSKLFNFEKNPIVLAVSIRAIRRTNGIRCQCIIEGISHLGSRRVALS